ncbi:flavin reductase (NADPH) isoform X2 [Megachile rotundata]|uniref:flavin reductase (NADPH) isoform X2 n=1 Tax=Megachile rotundata TaxID=143995 RepID=UPI000614C622|nr:PREDICTED: flavin reductase (NADPH) isoform X2 [Megachile rotundata]
MNRIVIFGATGNTGLCSLDIAVNKGLNVRVFVRDENKVPAHLKDKVEIVVGDVTNAEQVSNAIANRDAVVVVLGTRYSLSPTTVLSEGMKNIIEEFLFYKPEAVPSIFQDITKDHQRMFDVLKESQLKWIAVLPPHISDAKGGSKYLVTIDESPGRAISKHDLGAFLVESLQQPEYYQKVCGIANVS